MQKAPRRAVFLPPTKHHQRMCVCPYIFPKTEYLRVLKLIRSRWHRCSLRRIPYFVPPQLTVFQISKKPCPALTQNQVFFLPPIAKMTIEYDVGPHARSKIFQFNYWILLMSMLSRKELSSQFSVFSRPLCRQIIIFPLLMQ